LTGVRSKGQKTGRKGYLSTGRMNNPYPVKGIKPGNAIVQADTAKTWWT
jgi:hypothetical protein